MDLPSVRDFGRENSRPRSILIEQRKIILNSEVFSFAAAVEGASVILSAQPIQHCGLVSFIQAN
jgi:hypothetical protein